MAFLLVPLRSLGQDGWKIAAALMGRHIGGGNVRISCRWLVEIGNVDCNIFPNVMHAAFARY